MLQVNPVTTSVTWWKTINKSKHNYYANVYYQKNKEEIQRKARIKRANQSPEKKAEEAYKRKLRDCGVKHERVGANRKVLQDIKRDEGASL
jgi:hypothetical protein